MKPGVPCTLVLLLLFVAPFGGAEDERVASDLSEEARARLFVVPLRIESKSGARTGECATLGPDQFRIRIRNDLLRKKERLQQIDRGLIHLDRRPRPTLHAMVFDTSGSMSWDLPKAKDAARAYLDQTLGPADQGMVLGFDDAVTLWQRVTGDRSRLYSAIDRIEVGGQTSLFDALVSTIRELDVYRERPVLVVLSDGIDNGSFYDEADVLAELERRPDLVVFAISIGDRSEDSRKILRRIATSTFGRYFEIDDVSEIAGAFDEITDTLGKEAVLTVADPDPDPALEPKIQVTSTNNDCEVTILGQLSYSQIGTESRAPLPLTRPEFPYRIDAPLGPSHLKILRRATAMPGLAPCYDEELTADSQTLGWSFDVEEGRITGCVPDIALSHGYLYQLGNEQLISRNEDIRFKLRPFEITTPALDNLTRDPVDLLERIVLDLPGESSSSDLDCPTRDEIATRLPATPTLVHGTTFLEMRPRIVGTFFAQPEYRDWAMRRLQEWIDDDLRRLEERYRAMFPGHSDAGIRLALENSAEAQAIRQRLDHPTAQDLQPFLAAWLGDLDASELFLRWEIAAANRFLSEDETERRTAEFVHGWRRVRNMLSITSNARIVAPLVPLYEEDCDCIGFYRIALPRPSLMRARVLDRNTLFAPPKLDMPARLPFGFALLRALREQIPAAMKHLSGEGYVVERIRYGLLGPPEFHDPVRAFRETRVQLDLVKPGADRKSSRSAKLTADLHLALPPPRSSQATAGSRVPPRRPRWLLDSIDVSVKNDPELRKLFGNPKRALAGYELLDRIRPARSANAAGQPDPDAAN